MRRTRLAVALLGACATGVAAVAIAAPGVVDGVPVLASAAARVAEAGTQGFLLAASAAVGLYALQWARGGADGRIISGRTAAADRFQGALAAPPESAREDSERLTGRRLDASFDRAAILGGVPLSEARARLADLAVTRLTETAADREAARRAVERGTWTDDRVAAAFLAGSAGPVPSLRPRLREWLDPEAERERRIRRTVAAIEDIGGDQR